MQKLQFPKLALGTWSWGSGWRGGDVIFGNHLELEDLRPVFDRAIDAGLNLWDTAAAYGNGASESIVGNLIQGQPREKLMISTKFTPQIADAGAENPVLAMYQASCKRIGTDYFDVYWIHNAAGAPKWTKLLSEAADQMNVRCFGVSNHDLAGIQEANEILKAKGLKLGAVQNHYSLLDRLSETTGILDYCKENDIQFFAYMVLEQGALGGKYGTKHPSPPESDRGKTYNPVLGKIDILLEEISRVAANHNASPAQMPIAWAIAKGTLPIIGATKPEQIDDAVKATQIVLTEDEMRQLEKAAQRAELRTVRAWEAVK
ncbi:MAG: aldo/keto reductase [Oscillospiraceae bacterium]|nr:aldo/keto reductase [Oscillospiraceae bacterium]